MSTMDVASFEAEIRAAGYTDVSAGGFATGHDLAEHAHPYDLRALVLSGEFTVGVDGHEHTHRRGDIFELVRGTAHR